MFGGIFIEIYFLSGDLNIELEFFYKRVQVKIVCV